jgi:hypothetical protein
LDLYLTLDAFPEMRVMNTLSTWKIACTCAVSDGVPRRSLYVALIVGTVLNLINQGDSLLGAGSINWLKLVLTYCVPYAVCTYGAVSHQLAQRLPASGSTEPSTVSRP